MISTKMHTVDFILPAHLEKKSQKTVPSVRWPPQKAPKGEGRWTKDTRWRREHKRVNQA